MSGVYSLLYIQHTGVSTNDCAEESPLCPPQASVRGIGRELAAELVTETERLMRLYDTIPTTNEIIPGSKTTPPIINVSLYCCGCGFRRGEDRADNGSATPTENEAT